MTAADAVQRGWHVFPLIPGTKRPAVNDWENRASVELNRVVDYGNYGIACGPSRLLVVDLDNHGEADGIIGFRRLVDEHARGCWPDTLQISTPSGGAHLYFATLEIDIYRNTASKLGPGIDTRARGGFVVGPGSSDKRGAWELWCDRPIAPVPAWLAELLTARPEPVANSGVTIADLLRANSTTYSWSGLVATVALAPEGKRNSRLYWAAKQVGDDYRTGRCSSPWQALADLEDVGIRAGLPDLEVERTVKSGFNYTPKAVAS